MKYLLILGQTLLTLIIIIACSTKQQDDIQYSILVIGGESNISSKFGEFVNDHYSIKEVKHITSLDEAQKKYPDYRIEKTPAVYIFETGGGEMKKLKLKTYDIDEAVNFIRETKNK